MKKLFVITFVVVLAVSVGEGIFIFLKFKNPDSPIPTATTESALQKSDESSKTDEGKSAPAAKASETKIPYIGPLTNYEPYFTGKYDESIRTYAPGENGRPLYEELLPYGDVTHYAFNFRLSDYEIIQLSEFAYRTLQDCAYIQSSALIPKSKTYTVDEYISGELNGKLPFSAFRIKTDEKGVFYIPVSLDISFVGNWEKSEIRNIDGTDYRIFPFSGSAWYNDSTTFYEQPTIKSPVAFIYDYSKLGITNGYDYYPKVIEAAIALNGSAYWIKVETEIGSGWISSSTGNVERGGPIFHLPEDDLRFHLNLP